jgi:hypothetical protein
MTALSIAAFNSNFSGAIDRPVVVLGDRHETLLEAKPLIGANMF